MLRITHGLSNVSLLPRRQRLPPHMPSPECIFVNLQHQLPLNVRSVRADCLFVHIEYELVTVCCASRCWAFAGQV